MCLPPLTWDGAQQERRQRPALKLRLGIVSLPYLIISEFANILASMSVDKVFEALASGPRRQILAYLSKAELTTSELAARFKMSAPSMSRHLSVLENAGLVSSQRQGQRVLYRLNSDSLVNTLTGFALEICPVAGPLKRESRLLAKRRRATES